MYIREHKTHIKDLKKSSHLFRDKCSEKLKPQISRKAILCSCAIQILSCFYVNRAPITINNIIESIVPICLLVCLSVMFPINTNNKDI